MQECRHRGPGHETQNPWTQSGAMGKTAARYRFWSSRPDSAPRWKFSCFGAMECLCFSQVAQNRLSLESQTPPEAIGNPPGCESLGKRQLRRSGQVQDAAITLFGSGKCDLTEGSPNHESGVQLLPVTHLSGSWMTESQSHTSSPEFPRGDYRLTAEGFGLWLPTPTPDSQAGMLHCSGVG